MATMGVITRSRASPSRCQSAPSLFTTDPSSSSRFVEKIVDTDDELTKKALTTPARVSHWKKVVQERYLNHAQTMFNGHLEVEWTERGRDLTNTSVTFQITDADNDRRNFKIIQYRARIFWIKSPNSSSWSTAAKKNKLLTVTIFDDIKAQPSILVQGYSTPSWVTSEFNRLISLVDGLSLGHQVFNACGQQLSLLSGGDDGDDDDDDDDDEDEIVSFNPSISTLSIPPADSPALMGSLPNSPLAPAIHHEETLDLVRTRPALSVPSSPAAHNHPDPSQPSPDQDTSGTTTSQSVSDKSLNQENSPSSSTQKCSTKRITKKGKKKNKHPLTTLAFTTLNASNVQLSKQLQKANSEIQDLRQELETAKANLPSMLNVVKLQIMNELKASNESTERKISDLQTNLETISKENSLKDTKIKRLEDRISSLSHELRKRTTPVSNQSNITSPNSPPSPSIVPHQLSHLQSPPLASNDSNKVTSESQGDLTPQQNIDSEHPSTPACTLVIGDSNLRHLKPRRMDPLGQTSVRTLPGITINKLCSKLKDGEVQGHFSKVIMHVGTNDVRNFRSATEIVQDMRELIKQCRRTLNCSSIAVTEILPQFYDGQRYNPTNENREIKKLCTSMNVQWLPLAIHHISNFKQDGLHLSMKGVVALAKAVRPQRPKPYDECLSRIPSIVSIRPDITTSLTNTSVQDLTRQQQHNMGQLNPMLPTLAISHAHSQAFMPPSAQNIQQPGQFMNMNPPFQPTESVLPNVNTFQTDPIYPYHRPVSYFPFQPYVNVPQHNVCPTTTVR